MRLLPGVAALLLLAAHAWAQQAPSPVGRWTQIDDETGKPHSIVELFEEGDELRGRIVKGFPEPGETDSPICDKCPGQFRNQPIIGLVFMWGLKKHDDTWEDGHILDPDSGNIYSAQLRLIDGGRKLEVRGFLGMSLFGRTQVWER